MSCMKFPRGIILKKDELLYYIINQEVNHKAYQGLVVHLVSRNEAEEVSSKEFFCFKNDLCNDKEEYFMVDCRKSIFLEIEGCDFMYSTDEKLYSLCVTAYVLNSFGITPMQLMTNVITLTRQNNSEDTDEKGIIEENTEGKEAVTADVLPGEQKYSEEEKLISDCKLLAGCLNYAKSNNRILEVGGYMLCMDTLDKVGSYANLYHNIYTYLTDVSKTKMISIIRQSKKKYESQHSNKKE